MPVTKAGMFSFHAVGGIGKGKKAKIGRVAPPPPPPPPPEPFHIGDEAIPRDFTRTDNWTLVDVGHPADGTGKTTKIWLYPEAQITGVRLAIFYKVAPLKLTTRDWINLPDTPAGYHEYEVELNTVEGDFIGIYFATGSFYVDVLFHEQIYTAEALLIPCDNDWFDSRAGYAISLGGEGVRD